LAAVDPPRVEAEGGLCGLGALDERRRDAGVHREQALGLDLMLGDAIAADA
jgi:hypothetical protein